MSNLKTSFCSYIIPRWFTLKNSSSFQQAQCRKDKNGALKMVEARDKTPPKVYTAH